MRITHLCERDFSQKKVPRSRETDSPNPVKRIEMPYLKREQRKISLRPVYIHDTPLIIPVTSQILCCIALINLPHQIYCLSIRSIVDLNRRMAIDPISRIVSPHALLYPVRSRNPRKQSDSVSSCLWFM